MAMLKAQLNNIRNLGLEEVGLEDKFSYVTSQKKVARMSSMCFQGGNFRKVRLSYFDAGNSVQVFNSLWYPSYEHDSPLLGLDLISIGPNRVMCVCDFQPLYPTPEYSAIHIDALSSIRNKYPDLHGTLSGKIYDDTSFFSKQMLFGRFTDELKVQSVVGPALEEYLGAYISAVSNSTPNKDPKAMAAVQERQRAYDSYSAAKDPAIGLFEAYFGKEWAHSFVHDFLFDLSGDDTKTAAPPAVHNFQLNKDGDVVIAAPGSRQILTVAGKLGSSRVDISV
jgi:15,16-dihydrobiliverdin:ferredoxin oxidoreductase